MYWYREIFIIIVVAMKVSSCYYYSGCCHSQSLLHIYNAMVWLLHVLYCDAKQIFVFCKKQKKKTIMYILAKNLHVNYN